MSRVRWRSVNSPIGSLTLVADTRGLLHVSFETETRREPLDAERVDSDPVLDQAADQLAEYFEGTRLDFDLPLHPVGNSFELDVWDALTMIPFGETISYGEQARRIGKPGGAQAVGSANGRNPLAIVIPCHRVIGADGSLVGFGGGLSIKQWLLDHESGTQRLF